jgi:hypothetical protein
MAHITNQILVDSLQEAVWQMEGLMARASSMEEMIALRKRLAALRRELTEQLDERQDQVEEAELKQRLAEIEASFKVEPKFEYQVPQGATEADVNRDVKPAYEFTVVNVAHDEAHIYDMHQEMANLYEEFGDDVEFHALPQPGAFIAHIKRESEEHQFIVSKDVIAPMQKITPAGVDCMARMSKAMSYKEVKFMTFEQDMQLIQEMIDMFAKHDIRAAYQPVKLANTNAMASILYLRNPNDPSNGFSGPSFGI